MIRSLRLLVVWLVATFMAAASFAHQQKAAMTDIFVNPRTNNIEVVHSFILHDAETALFAATGMTGDLYRDQDTQSAFADYAVSQFDLKTDSQSQVELALLGFEIDAGRLLIYQEAPAPPDLTAVEIRAGALRDVWPDQVNTVNVRHGEILRTLVFTGNDGAKVAVLSPTP